MELTVDQMLQQGVAAHNAGNPKEAARLYQAILEVQPEHPDANHNLALIAISMNRYGAALPLFKKAINVNPNIEQFWLSYIDALIKDDQIDYAKKFVKKAKKRGFDSKKLKTLLSNTRLPAAVKVPSQQQLNNLLEHYQNGRFSDAEDLAISITYEFPRHQFSWKVLGAVLGQVGRTSEAAYANQKGVALSPQDAEAHNNLGTTLQELGRLKEAEASYREAIAIKADYSEAFSNLGNALKELGRLEEAEASLRQATALKPDYAEAYNNLGITLQELGRLKEAAASLGKAVALKPDYAEAHCNLGITFQELGKLERAKASYMQAITLKLNFSEAHYNLGVLFFDSKQYIMASEQFELSASPQSKLYATRCSYLKDEQAIFYEKLDLLINQGELNAVIGSLSCCAEIKYGIKRSNPFCNEPLQYVLKTDLNKQYDFEEIFVKTASDVLIEDSVSRRTQGILTNGVQTAGNIFAVNKISETNIESIIHAEIEKYRVHFKDSDEGFITNWPSSYKINGWIVSMQLGGKLAAHMHELGWISGSIYINVPKKSKASSGNLVLCLGEEAHERGVKKSQESIIDVETGSLCLFPSSLHHYTLPFEEEENRIVLAFDVMPTK